MSEDDHIQHRIGNAEEPGTSTYSQQFVVIGTELENPTVARLRAVDNMPGVTTNGGHPR